MDRTKLTLALVAASIAVTCDQLSAEIRVEAVGLPDIRLQSCPQTKPLACSNYHQYKVIGHFSRLSLGDANNEVVKAPATRLWNRLFINTGTTARPLDIFKSSTKANTSTGHQVMSCSSIELAQQKIPPTVRIDGTTANPSGKVILCVDFIPTPPKPRGKLKLPTIAVRDGQKVTLGWSSHR